MFKKQNEENAQKNEQKRRKVSMRTTSFQEKMQFKCDICKAIFEQKCNLNKHVATIHEGKKPFKWDIYIANFGWKSAACMLQQSMKEKKNDWMWHL